MELLKLKQLLGISPTDTKQDNILQFLIENVEETILNYCHLKKLPSGLLHTAYRMTIDLYQYDRPSADTNVVVSSISEGDTTTSFKNAADILQESILKDYKTQLNLYRKLVFR